MTVNGIGDEGAKAISELLKVNKTLKELHLFGEEERGKDKENESSTNGRK